MQRLYISTWSASFVKYWLMPFTITLVGYLYLPVYRPHSKLVVIVPSARENSELRQAIRQTWAKTTSQNTDITVKFVIGEHPCLIPPAYRKTHSCEIDINEKSVQPTGKLSNAFGYRNGQCKQASVVGIRVKHSVILNTAVISCAYELRVNVSFVDPITGEVYEFIPFAKIDNSSCQNGFRKVMIEPLLLPQNLDIQLHFSPETPNPLPCCYNESSALLDVTYVYDTASQKLSHNFTNYCGPNFLFSVPGSLKDLMRNKESAYKAWLQQVTHQDSVLKDEHARHGDLLFAPMVDTYRNVSSKLLWSYWWTTTYLSFDYLIKVDDDTLINLDAVLKELAASSKISSRSWWGHFRWNWPVLRAGKWAEYDYAASIYPPFACGSAYLLGRDLAEFMGKNINLLKRYQGEDVSLGVWLSAVETVYEDDERWCCHANCSPSWIQGQLTAESMLNKWPN